MQEMLDGSRVSAIVTDPAQTDNPIIFTNRTFENMTGYTQEEALGRNCRFLQGEETDHSSVMKIRKAIAERVPITLVVKNYKKNGTLFWNRLSIRPVMIEGARYFIGTQTDVSVQYRQIEELQCKDTEIERLMLPIMMIDDKLAAVSLVGQMNEERFSLLIEKLSGFVHVNEVDHMMLDITGLDWQEGTPIDRLLEIQQILELMGSCLYITGVSPKLARNLAMNKNPSQVIKTFSSIQQAIYYIRVKNGK
ncbi:MULTISPECIES: PAS domain-containing protein [Sporosarcina]|uniref:PAS domain-containing protein n=1 Tax=Sporosarcina TaxID=1569 RepID=UPI00129A8E1E|nr:MULTISPECIES: PAS domain-containing protein [Sporosarcina]GKV65287.1 blue-light photoreceptor [Sporosarcina sp. NCCP-2331]GLB55411.1 blue-light photoreceptor [Sporosarcina sp. NCCP-2378]